MSIRELPRADCHLLEMRLQVTYDEPDNKTVHEVYVLQNVSCSGKARYSTFQYPDQDPYQDQDQCPEDFNADALFHVSVSVKRIFHFEPYF